MTEWDTLSFGAQFGLWLFGTLVFMTAVYVVATVYVKIANRMFQLPHDKKFRTPTRAIVTWCLALSLVVLLGIIGIPSIVTYPSGVGIVLVGLASALPFVLNSTWMNAGIVRTETVGWTPDDWVTVTNHRWARSGWFQETSLTRVRLHDPDTGKSIFVSHYDFLHSVVENDNWSGSARNPNGFMRVPIPFHFPPNGVAEHARAAILTIAHRLHVKQRDRHKYKLFIEDDGEGYALEILDVITPKAHTLTLHGWVENREDAVTAKSMLYSEVARAITGSGILFADVHRTESASVPVDPIRPDLIKIKMEDPGPKTMAMALHALRDDESVRIGMPDPASPEDDVEYVVEEAAVVDTDEDTGREIEETRQQITVVLQTGEKVEAGVILAQDDSGRFVAVETVLERVEREGNGG